MSTQARILIKRELVKRGWPEDGTWDLHAAMLALDALVAKLSTERRKVRELRADLSMYKGRY